MCMAYTKKPVKKANEFSFVVVVREDRDGNLAAACGAVKENGLADELNLREFVENFSNSYFGFLDSLDVEDEGEEEDECEMEEEIPVPKRRVVKK